jgi:O-antigen/teichoic acid export membrane protein
MTLFFKKNQNNLLFNNLYSWSKLIAITGSAQLIIQVIGFISGIIVIRMLPTHEYAIYTLGNTLLGTMVILANGGISTGVMAQGSKVWQDKAKLGEVMVTGLALRKKFATVTLIVGTPILMYLLLKNEASWLMTTMVVLTLIPAFITSLSASLLGIVPTLHQDIVPFQKNQLAVNFGRLLLLCLVIFIFPFAFVAILASSIPQIWGNLNLRRIAKKHVDLQQSPSPMVSKNILSTVKRIYPQAVYSSFSGQITIWILSIFGTTTAIAQIGALGRIAMILTLITAMFNTLIAPRFARLIEDFKLLLKHYLQILLLVSILFIFIIAFVCFFPSQILLILGSKYANLQHEIILVIIGSCLASFCGIIYSLYSQRGWIINPVLSISLNISALVFAIFLVDVKTLEGVLILNIIVESILLIVNSFYGFFKIFKLKNTVDANMY